MNSNEKCVIKILKPVKKKKVSSLFIVSYELRETYLIYYFHWTAELNLEFVAKDTL